VIVARTIKYAGIVKASSIQRDSAMLFFFLALWILVSLFMARMGQ
jgi:hypothetical protein